VAVRAAPVSGFSADPDGWDLTAQVIGMVSPPPDWAMTAKNMMGAFAGAEWGVQSTLA